LPAAFKSSIACGVQKFKGSIAFGVQKFNCLRRSKGSRVQLPEAFKGSIAFGVQKVQMGLKGLGFVRVLGLKLKSLVSPCHSSLFTLHFSLFTFHFSLSLSPNHSPST
jgi:hypothetical protein